ncbi:hypothetical protein L195_g042996 [Trifolium pratense]|uniref:Uncharacterized protein n=1 Tax=Trifolium pratense TaxID=57577 RepID=A0A2K3M823_TRIPR|nr:hypothetical protein L195_g042996 [Trifolium pratense]
MRLLDAPKRTTATKTISGKKAVGIGYKNSHATSSSNPSQSLDFGYSKIQESMIGALMGSSSFSQSVPYKKKADAPMRLLPATKPSTASAYAPMRLLTASNPSATSSYKPSRSLYSGAPSMKKQAAPKASNSKVQGSSTGLLSVAAPSCPLLTYQWQVL